MNNQSKWSMSDDTKQNQSNPKHSRVGLSSTATMGMAPALSKTQLFEISLYNVVCNSLAENLRGDVPLLWGLLAARIINTSKYKKQKSPDYGM